MAITVGASSDLNQLTTYSTYGFFSPRTNAGEDFKPDVIAPGGSPLRKLDHVRGQRYLRRLRHGQGARRLREC